MEVPKHHRAILACILGIAQGDAPDNVCLGLMTTKMDGKDVTALVVLSKVVDHATGNEHTFVEPIGTLINLGDAFDPIEGAAENPKPVSQEVLDQWIERAEDYEWLQELDEHNTQRMLQDVKGSA